MPLCQPCVPWVPPGTGISLEEPPHSLAGLFGTGGGRHQHLFSCCQFSPRKSVLFPLCQMCSNFSGISFPPVVVHVAQPSFWAQPRSLPERLCPGETSQLQTVCGADIIATDLGPMHGRNESWQRAVLCSALSLPPATCSHRTAPGTRSHSRWLQGWPSPTWCLPCHSCSPLTLITLCRAPPCPQTSPEMPMHNPGEQLVAFLGRGQRLVWQDATTRVWSLPMQPCTADHSLALLPLVALSLLQVISGRG